MGHEECKSPNLAMIARRTHRKSNVDFGREAGVTGSILAVQTQGREGA